MQGWEYVLWASISAVAVGGCTFFFRHAINGDIHVRKNNGYVTREKCIDNVERLEEKIDGIASTLKTIHDELIRKRLK